MIIRWLYKKYFFLKNSNNYPKIYHLSLDPTLKKNENRITPLSFFMEDHWGNHIPIYILIQIRLPKNEFL